MGRTSIGDLDHMRGFLASLFLVLVALGAGAVGYNIGVSQAVTAAAGSAGATVVYAGGWHLGGLLLLPLAFLLVPLFFMTFFGFLAFAFGPRRRFGHGGWGGHGHWAGAEGGHGPAGFGPMGGGFGPGHGFDRRREWVAEAHRRLHEEEARTASAPSSAGSASTPSDGPTAG